MGYDLMYPNLLRYICAQVYPQTDVVLEDILSIWKFPADIVSFLYLMKLCDGRDVIATPLTFCL